MPIAAIQTDHFRIPLPVVLSDSTHGEITHFELVTARVRDTDGAEGLGYTYTVGHGGDAIRSLIARELAPLLAGQEADHVEQLAAQRAHFQCRGCHGRWPDAVNSAAADAVLRCARGVRSGARRAGRRARDAPGTVGCRSTWRCGPALEWCVCLSQWRGRWLRERWRRHQRRRQL